MFLWSPGADISLLPRQHPAVVNQAGKVFVFIAQALEAETLVGQTANRVVQVTKGLLQSTSVDPSPLLQQFSPQAQQTIMGFFN
jgi:hypothetical protein